MTPTELITAAEVKLNAASANIADAYTLLEQAKVQLAQQPPTPPTLYALSVLNGSGDGSYAAGTVVPIMADSAPNGQQFAGWTGPVENPAAANTTIVMPAAATIIGATYVPIVVVPPTPGGRIATLVHLGSFKVPQVGVYDADGYAYGGTSLGYNPAKHSLFLAGFVNACKVGEISIPTLGATAASLQAPVDPCGGKIGQINPGDPNQKLIGGTLVNGAQLVVSAYSYYDGSGSQVLSHFVRPAALGSGPVTGPLRVGPLGAGFYSGYMGVVDPAWVSKFRGPALTGNACLGVVSRTSYGPSVASFDPNNIGTAVELVGYPDAHQTLGPWNQANQFFGGSDQVKGVAMPVGFGTVLFVGRHGTTFCYGPGVGTQPPPSGSCYDPTDGSKGVHGYAYRAVAWLYDANDLAAVAAGSKLPWDAKPYSLIDLPGINPNARIGGCALDTGSNRIYVSEMNANGTLPVIHVYEAKS